MAESAREIVDFWNMTHGRRQRVSLSTPWTPGERDRVFSHTVGKAWIDKNGTPVVWLEGCAHPVPLAKLAPVSTADDEAVASIATLRQEIQILRKRIVDITNKDSVAKVLHDIACDRDALEAEHRRSTKLLTKAGVPLGYDYSLSERIELLIAQRNDAIERAKQ